MSVPAIVVVAEVDQIWVEFFCISCRDVFSLRVCIFYISFGTHYIDIRPWSSHKLRGLNWVSKNRRPLHNVEILPGCTDEDPKDTPNRVFNKLAWRQNFGTEGGSEQLLCIVCIAVSARTELLLSRGVYINSSMSSEKFFTWKDSSTPKIYLVRNANYSTGVNAMSFLTRLYHWCHSARLLSNST